MSRDALAKVTRTGAMVAKGRLQQARAARGPLESARGVHPSRRPHTPQVNWGERVRGEAVGIPARHVRCGPLRWLCTVRMLGNAYARGRGLGSA
jgi:hypothetical protein